MVFPQRKTINRIPTCFSYNNNIKYREIEILINYWSPNYPPLEYLLLNKYYA